MSTVKALLVAIILSLALGTPASADEEFQPVNVYWAHAASTTNVVTLSGLGLTIGGVVLPSDGMIALLTNQTIGTDNGPWIIHSGAWDRLFPSTVRDCIFYVRKGTNRGVCGGRDWGAIDHATGLPKPSQWDCN